MAPMAVAGAICQNLLVDAHSACDEQHVTNPPCSPWLRDVVLTGHVTPSPPLIHLD
jgi:hypothetical protein